MDLFLGHCVIWLKIRVGFHVIFLGVWCGCFSFKIYPVSKRKCGFQCSFISDC